MIPQTPSDVTKSPRTFIAWHRRLAFWVVILIVVLFVMLLHQAQLAKRQRKGNHLQPAVVVATAQKKDLPFYLTGLGSVVPTANVTVRTQITGTLLQVFFHEGQMVNRGERLAEIDPRPYQAALMQYQGQLTRDKALLANALLDLKRYQTLWKQDSIAQQTLNTQQSLVKQYQGAIQIDQGLIDATKINLIYCEITAPVSGRVGLRFIDPGNYVQTTDTNGIAVITALDPITIIFTLPEDQIPAVISSISSGNKLLVYAYNRQQTQLLAVGQLLAMDNEIDPSTGTVRLRGQFTNHNQQLFPNQFVNVRLLIHTLHNVVTLPTAAVQYDTTGSFVYVIGADDKVKVVPVTVGITIADETEIKTGIVAGQSVVIEGADNLADGMQVKLTTAQGKYLSRVQIKKSPIANFLAQLKCHWLGIKSCSWYQSA
ncbi:MAG TPA: MdtA/MuxA family multidrug efflux RND transporter periplasmic adaptor subunit [Candidatus Saccharimonadales bacterium]